jgi:hypothetical protein
MEYGGHYWRLITKPRDAGCGATSHTLLAEGWAQEWGAAVALVHAAARHHEIKLEGPGRTAQGSVLPDVAGSEGTGVGRTD